MTDDIEIPTQAQFLAAPRETVAAVAPKSMVYAPGGTRRSAVFAGVEPWSPAYLTYLHDQFSHALETIFRYDVAHVFTPMVMVNHIHEVKRAEDLMVQLGEFATSPYLLDIFAKHGWRLRLAPSAYTDLLQPYMQTLAERTAPQAAHTWWLTCTPTQDSWWSMLFAAAKSGAVTSRADAIHALYGEALPLIELCLAFGKPMTSPDLYPPLLMDSVQGYWSQQVGCSLTDAQFRTILYDYGYLRHTWQKDKTARAKLAKSDQSFWEQEAILGLGQRIGPFWYPSFPATSPTPSSTPSSASV